jgi:hypothetical protein
MKANLLTRHYKCYYIFDGFTLVMKNVMLLNLQMYVSKLMVGKWAGQP